MIYETFKLEDVLDVIIDYRGKTPQKSDEGIVTLSAKSVRDGYIDYSQCYFISIEEYERFMVRGFPQVGDVLLTTEAPLGVTARLDRDDVALAQRLLTLRGKPGILDTGFLYYYLRSPIGQAKLRARQTGTTVTGIKQSEFRKIEIDLPNIEAQRKAASILEIIDEKIALNKTINQNLMEQLQTLYNGVYAPETRAKTGVLSDICQYSTDKVCISELSLSTYYSTENMLPNKAGSVEASNLPAVLQTTKCKKGDVLISNIRPYFKKIVYVNQDCGCSTDVLCFSPLSNKYSAFLFGTLYADRFFEHMVAGAKGTKMPRGDKQQIMDYPIVIPTDQELNDYNKKVLPLLELSLTNLEQNTTLTFSRDTLLPRIMSGELDVSGLEL